MRSTFSFLAGALQGELAVKGRQWADFVVWTLAPADNIFVERIMADESFWRDTFPAKAGTVLHVSHGARDSTPTNPAWTESVHIT